MLGLGVTGDVIYFDDAAPTITKPHISFCLIDLIGPTGRRIVLLESLLVDEALNET